MNFTVKAFAELSPAELHAIYTARVAVFVVEQACPYQEVDAQDPAALHIFAEQNGKVIAYCRLIPHGACWCCPGIAPKNWGAKSSPLPWTTPARISRNAAFMPKRKPIWNAFTPRLDLPANPPLIWKTIFRILICYCPPRNHSGSTRFAVKSHTFRLPNPSKAA